MQHDEESRQGLRHQVVDIALNHHLVTPFTSLVAVDKTPVRPEVEALQKHAIKSNAPKGTQFGLARTATGMDAFIWAGRGLLLLGLCFLWLSRPCKSHTKCSA